MGLSADDQAIIDRHQRQREEGAIRCLSTLKGDELWELYQNSKGRYNQASFEQEILLRLRSLDR